MKLPNNKTASLVVFVALIVTIVISYNEYRKDKPQKTTPTELQSQPKATIIIENKIEAKDLDSDGLSDWEEMLWKTDTKKKDTDGDGTSDGEEVALSRDPLKKGPNDKYNSSATLAENYTPFFKTDADSLTSQVAKTVFSKSTQGAGPEAVAEITNQIKAELAISKIFRAENLITFDSSNKKKMEKYSTELIQIQIDEISNVSKNISDPYVYSDSYKNMALRLSAISVPNNFTGLHTDYVNNFNALSVMAKRIADSEKDPIVLLATIPEYEKLSDAQKLILEQIKLYFENNGIIFANSNE